MIIRLETPNDYREVENLTREAFWNVYRPGCTEHYVLNQYRTNPDFIPELDLVMEEDNRIIGHVMFSKAKIALDSPHSQGGDGGGSFPSWTFGPISIHPDYKCKGYGLKLLKYALEKAREMGIGFICMEGNIAFYKNAGFDLASKLNIHYHSEPKDAEVPYFLAQELIPGWLRNNVSPRQLIVRQRAISLPTRTQRLSRLTKPLSHRRRKHSKRDNYLSSARVAVCR